MKLAIVICTKDRHKLLTDLLKSLKRSGNHPHSIHIVDDISDSKPSNVASVCTTIVKPTKLVYHPVKFRSISKSRNFALKIITDDILLFIDDDVEIRSNITDQIIQNHQTSPNVASFTPSIKPTDNNYFSIIFAHWMNNGYDLLTKKTPRSFAPGACFSLRTSIIKQNHIHFPHKLKHISEDTVFFLKITNKRLFVFHDPNIVIFHKYNHRSIWEIIQRFFIYGQAIPDTIKYYHHLFPYDLSWIYPKRLLDYLLFPLYIVSTIIKISTDFIKNNQLGTQLILPTYIILTSYIIGAYSNYNLTNKFITTINKRLHLL